MTRSAASVLSAGLTVAVGLFLALMAVAVSVYPGGTWMDRRARGFDFARNFLCDLMGPTAINGEPNRLGAAVATAGMLVLIAGVTLFWLVLPTLFSRRARLGAWIRACGLLALFGSVAIPLTSWLRLGHPTAIFLASGPNLLAALLGTVGLLAEGKRQRGPAALGAATLGVTVVDGVLYTLNTVQGGEVPVALPALQRVALLLLLAWMLSVARAAPHKAQT